jgi:hypothetical protein|tara:strand:+ start:133 stop:927 length:795 start_codon:yes stop_codon:yes gene_type:complete
MPARWYPVKIKAKPLSLSSSPTSIITVITNSSYGIASLRSPHSWALTAEINTNHQDKDMDENVPYMNSVKKLHPMLDKIQNAGVPETFNKDFLVDLGYTSSYDTALIKLLRYLGMLDSSNKPQDSYRQFVDHTKAKTVLAQRIRVAYDDLYLSDKNADSKQTNQLQGWFKTKTGSGEAVAKKIASTFKSLADYADFSGVAPAQEEPSAAPKEDIPPVIPGVPPIIHPKNTDIGLVYRFEIHLPDTQNVDTFRAIFKALREELMP